VEDEVIPLIEGADKLIGLYGYWITFHDAAVETVVIERVGPTITIHFRTNDWHEETDNRDFIAKVVMRWLEVEDFMLSGVDEQNWIGNMHFTRLGDVIRTEVKPMDGTHGFIRARRVEVVSADPVLKPRSGER
jgi:hypothetical protein